jgi:non-heme chloroperoxidase
MTLSIRVPGGVRLAYVDRGARSPSALVLLHGLSDSLRSFEPLLECLPSSLRALAVSLRGHGDSDRPEHGYGLRDFAGDVRGLLDALEIESALVVGHSLGASVALRFALDHPERTRGLVLLGAFARYRNNAAVSELRSVIAQLGDPVDGAFIRDFQLATLARPIAPAFLEQVVQESRRLPAHAWSAIIESLVGADGELPLAGVRAPTLLLSGARDAFVPRTDQERLLAGIPDCRWREYPDGGHAFHWEDPAPVAADLVRFSARCLGAGS